MPRRTCASAALALALLAGCAGAPARPAADGAGRDAAPAGAAPAPPVPGPELTPTPTPAPAEPALRERSGCPAAMAAVPGGRLSLGGKQVQVAPFCLDATEVTLAAWRRCAAAGACAPASTSGAWAGMAPDERAASGRLCNEGRPGREAHPVNCVSFAEAARFCAWRGARLPSEAELAWAARGGPRGSRWPWGDAPPTTEACWARAPGRAGDAAGATCPVGSHPQGRSPQGLHDLAGNVAEWAVGPAGAPVARGGSFVDVLAESLSADGGRWAPAPERSGAIGLRCAAAPR